MLNQARLSVTDVADIVNRLFLGHITAVEAYQQIGKALPALDAINAYGEAVGCIIDSMTVSEQNEHVLKRRP